MIEDRNEIPELIQALDDLSRKKVQIGILGEEGHEGSDATVLEIAVFHEFGTVNVPERSFVRAGFDQNEAKITRKIEFLLGKVLDRRLSADAFYELIGAEVTGILQEFLIDLRDPPLLPGTVKRKKSSNPLVDSGQLVGSITWRVVNV